MMEVLKENYQHFLDQGDPRLKDWFLMQSPLPGFTLIAFYIYFVKVAGPKFMEKREPYKLRTLMIFYNFTLVIVNFYLFWSAGNCGWWNGYSLLCQPVDFSNNADAVHMAKLAHYYYLIKFIEFADTIFFILRKKYSQVTVLHVVHHSLVPFLIWFGVKFGAGGQYALFPFLNCFVHVLMYSYYGLAAMGGKYRKYLVWKKYMTTIQLMQFLIVLVHATLLIINGCTSSYVLLIIYFLALLFFVLFLNFYLQNYLKKSDSSSKNKLEIYEKQRLFMKNHDD